MTDSTPGAYVKSVRLKLGLSQVALANLLGVSNVSVNRWEHNRVRPDAATMARIRLAERDGVAAISAELPRGNLPVIASPLLGREHELARLSKLLESRRLVTVTGTGGAGKTRLSIEVGRQLADRYPDGVWFVDLASVVDPDGVVHACLHALPVTDGSRRPLLDRMVAFLAERRSLVVLDNCEHLLSACAELAARVLRSSTTSRLLATSRSPLGVDGEAVFRLPALSIADAEALLIAKASERRSNFVPTDGERAAISKLCERLDRLPLAIELAAARLNVLSPAQILERLDRRFELLASSGNRPERQRTLAAAIGWSADLLDPAEAALFRGLGVFVGWFDLPAVEAVCGIDGAVRLLDRLADQSMIVVDHQTTTGTPRYRLLESLAAFAAERLERVDESTDIRGRHTRHYADRIVSAARQLHDAEQASLLAALDRDYDNGIAALRWAIASGDAKLALAIAAGYGTYWQRRGRFDEGSGFLAQALAIDAAGHDNDRARALTALGMLLGSLGKLGDAERAFEEALAIGDRELQARAIDGIGLLCHTNRDLDRAETQHRASIAIWHDLGDRRGEATGRINLGHVSMYRGDPANAEREYRFALALLIGTGDVAAEAAVLANLAEVASLSRRFSEALIYIERALDIVQSFGDPDRIDILLTNQAEVLIALAKPDRALEPARIAVSHFRASGRLVQLAGALYVVGEALRRLGRYQESLDRLREAVSLYFRLDDWGDLAFTVEVIAGLMTVAGDAALAARWLAAAAEIRGRLGLEPWPLFDYAATRSATQNTLGDRFESSWSSGLGLAQDELVAEVLHLSRVENDAVIRPPATDVALTNRQVRVLELAAEGLSNREIADRLAISPRTVERHLTALFTVLGVERRSAAIAIAIDRGFLARRRS